MDLLDYGIGVVFCYTEMTLCDIIATKKQCLTYYIHNYTSQCRLVQTTSMFFSYTKNKWAVELLFVDSTAGRVADFSLILSGFWWVKINWRAIHTILVLISRWL